MTPQAAVLVRLQDSQLDKADHGCLLHTRVRFLGAVCHQLREEGRLLRVVAKLEPQRPDHLSAGSEQAVEDALAGAGLVGISKLVKCVTASYNGPAQLLVSHQRAVHKRKIN